MSTTASTFRPWQFFVLAGLIAATGGVFLSAGTTPANIILVSLIIGGAALTGMAVYRTLAPLMVADDAESPETVSARTRAALERDKMLVLRSIKELEFDRAMNKVSASDYDEMVARLRARAVGIIRQLDSGASGYRELIERELASRLGRAAATGAGAGASAAIGDATESVVSDEAAESVEIDEGACRGCGTFNEPDARFCKHCGVKLIAAVLFVVAMLVPALVLAQPDLRMMAGIPRPDGNLADGAITVRVVRQTLANNITDHPVELIVGGEVQTTNTDAEGRATFRAPTPGTIVRAATDVDGERLESQEFPAPDRGGVAVMLVAGLGDAPTQQAARPGSVSIGADSRFIVDLINDRLEIYYLLQVVNPAPYPVSPPQPVIFDLPSGAAGAGPLNGSSPQVVIRGDRVTLTSPIPPGITPIQIGFTMPYSGGELTIEQRMPAALSGTNVVMRKIGDMALSSAQLSNQQETTVQGEQYVMGAGPGLGPDTVLSFTLSGLPHHSRVPLTVAAVLAGLILVTGLWVGVGGGDRGGTSARRKQLESRREKVFAELLKLEAQRRAGEIDVARHKSRRATLMAQLERIYGEIDAQGTPAGGNKGLAA